MGVAVLSHPMEPAGVPLTIGIIGHRDPIPEEASSIATDIRTIVASYREAFPDVPIVLLTSLAEGADQLGAMAVAGLPGVSVVAMLPLSASEFAEDFEGEALSQFQTLLARSQFAITADELTPGVREGQSRGSREASYQRCGRLLAQHSHVLIAAWDGRPPELAGGTADTVYARAGAQALPDLSGVQHLWPDEGGQLLHIPTRRRRHGGTATAPDGSEGIQGPLIVETELAYKPWRSPLEDATAARFQAVNTAIDDPGGGSHLSVTEAIMDSADRRAGALQRRFRHLSAWVLAAGVVFLMAVNLEQSLEQQWLVLSVLATLGVTAGLWWLLHRSGANRLYQEARALAEGARVQATWIDVGVEACPSDWFLLGQRDVAWIRRVLRSAWLMDRLQQSETARSGSPPREQDQVAAARAWIEGQLSYFLGTRERLGAIERNRRNARRTGVATAAGLVLAAAGLGLDTAQRLGAAAHLGPLPSALWDLGLGVAAASAAYAQLMAYTEVARQLEASAQAFTQGRHELDRADGIQRVREVVQLVGTTALAETSSWLTLKVDRSVRPI